MQLPSVRRDIILIVSCYAEAYSTAGKMAGNSPIHLVQWVVERISRLFSSP